MKSYSILQGYGFLANVDGVNQDVRFRRDDLPGQLFNEANLKGTQLRFSLVKNGIGKEVKLSASNLQDPKGLPTFKSTVKSFNMQKGYGFIACPPDLESFAGNKKDVFMSSRILKL